MKTREFREIQVSSTQLAIIFLGILAIGVVIFLLGVSVGKKHAQVAKQANVIAPKEPEQIKEKIVSLPQTKPDQGASTEAAEKPTPTQTDTTPAKVNLVPKKPADKPQTETTPEEAGAPAGARPAPGSGKENPVLCSGGSRRRETGSPGYGSKIPQAGLPGCGHGPPAAGQETRLPGARRRFFNPGAGG